MKHGERLGVGGRMKHGERLGVGCIPALERTIPAPPPTKAG